MDNTLITYKVAKLAVEAGYDIPADRIYYADGSMSEYNYDRVRSMVSKEFPPVCTQSLVCRWLREIHNIDIFVRRLPKRGSGVHCGYVMLPRTSDYIPLATTMKTGGKLNTYEECLEATLEWVLGYYIFNNENPI